MTRLFDAPHGQIHEFDKRLQAAGLTAEHVKMLLADDSHLRAWVAKVDENVEPDPIHDRVPIAVEAAFGGKGGVMNRLQRAGFVYLDEVAELTELEFLSMRGFGQTSLSRTRSALSRHGLTFSKTYSIPPAIVCAEEPFDWCYYRPRVKEQTLWRLVSVGDRACWATDIAPVDTTLGEFMTMSVEQRSLLLSDRGIAKVDAFIAVNGL